MYLMAAVFSLTGYLGINFVLVLVRSFGALLAVTGIQSHGYSAASVVQHNIIQCHGYLWVNVVVFFSDYIPKGRNDGTIIFTLHQAFHSSVSTTMVIFLWTTSNYMYRDLFRGWKHRNFLPMKLSSPCWNFQSIICRERVLKVLAWFFAPEESAIIIDSIPVWITECITRSYSVIDDG